VIVPIFGMDACDSLYRNGRCCFFNNSEKYWLDSNKNGIVGLRYEEEVLISASDADRKDHEFKSTMNGPLVDVLNIWTFKRVKNQIFRSIYIVTMKAN
jgi:hypothetical protein